MRCFELESISHHCHARMQVLAALGLGCRRRMAMVHMGDRRVRRFRVRRAGLRRVRVRRRGNVRLGVRCR